MRSGGRLDASSRASLRLKSLTVGRKEIFTQLCSVHTLQSCMLSPCSPGFLKLAVALCPLSPFHTHTHTHTRTLAHKQQKDVPDGPPEDEAEPVAKY